MIRLLGAWPLRLELTIIQAARQRFTMRGGVLQLHSATAAPKCFSRRMRYKKCSETSARDTVVTWSSPFAYKHPAYDMSHRRLRPLRAATSTKEGYLSRGGDFELDH